MKHLSNAVTLICCYMSLAACHGEHWNRFRGPNGSGVAAHVDFPSQWTDDDWDWSSDVPGSGHSSPVIWEQRLFVQSGDDEGHLRYVLCYDTETGQLLWQRDLPAQPHSIHSRNSFGSSTPTVDATGVYAAWGSSTANTLTKFDLDGKVLWEQPLGPFQCQHGPAIAPILVDQHVICAMLQEAYRNREPAAGEIAQHGSVVAFDKQTGAPAWQAELGCGTASYAVPCTYLNAAGEKELICCSTADGMFSLAPATGRLSWSLPVFQKRTVGSPLVAGRWLLGTNGSGGGGNYLVAIEAGDEPREVFRIDRQAPYVPTPVYKDGLLFLWSDRGVASCVDPTNQETFWKERAGTSLSASPICVGDRLVCVTDDGQVIVLAASRKFERLGTSSLGGAARATPAVDRRRIYFRTESKLLALGAR